MRIDVKRLTTTAKLPTIAYGGDLGYDLYADESVALHPGITAIVSTGIAIEMYDPWVDPWRDTPPRKYAKTYGGLIRDRSSMAIRGIVISGGVIDAGYRGEILVTMTLLGAQESTCIFAGEKIAQIIPILAEPRAAIYDVKDLTESERGEKRHGSSGR